MERYYGAIIDYVDGHEIETDRYYAYDSGEIYDEVLQEYLYIKPRSSDGYCTTMLYNSEGRKVQLYVHRIVAATLINSELKYNNSLVVNHIDPVARYNNSVENLEVCTQKENIEYAIKLGRFKVKGEDNPTANLTNDIVHEICSIMEENPNKTYKSIAEDLNLTHLKAIEDTIGKIRQGKEWIFISSQYNLQKRSNPKKGVRVSMSYFNDEDKRELENIILKNPELKSNEISKLVSIDLSDHKKYHAFKKMVARMKKRLL